MSRKISKLLAALFIPLALTFSLSACSGAPAAKPAKDAVVQGLTKEMGSSAGDELTKKVVTCIVDKIYDKGSAAMLNAIAKGDKSYKGSADSYKGSADEEKLLTDAATTCTSEMLKP